MEVKFTTIEAITDEQILRAFGEALLNDGDVFKAKSFFEYLADSAGASGLDLEEPSKVEVLKQLKAILIELIKGL